MKIAKAFILYHENAIAKANAEECALSCQQHGIEYELFKGFELNGGRDGLQARVPYPITFYWHAEMECTAGHVAIWEKIARMPDGQAYAVFENDVIARGPLPDIPIEFRQVVFLGYRVRDRNTYKPVPASIRVVALPGFEGAHAYAITPETARFFMSIISRFGIIAVSDGMLGVNNQLGSKLAICDPPPVVCEVRKWRSFGATADPNDTVRTTAFYNVNMTENFILGLDHSLRQYYA